jgi:hypothetical protein
MLAGCTSGNSAIEPTVRGVSPLAGKLTFAVGTANYTLPLSGVQASGLNTVVAFRQANGLSDALVTTPTITGPSGFLVPAAATSANGDAGTGHISGDAQTPVAENASASTFGQAGGAFSYGFLPANSTNNSDSGAGAVATPYGNPFYYEAVGGSVPAASYYPTDYPYADDVIYEGGPPTFTNVLTGTYPSGFTGYTLGFDSFVGVTTPAGSYNLSLAVPTSSTTSATVSATATLGSTATLPVYSPPTIVEDGSGGGTITLSVPAGVTETVVEVQDFGDDTPGNSACHPSSGGAPIYGIYNSSTGAFTPYNYTVVDHTPGPATATVTLPDGVGPISASGVGSPTLCANDNYTITAVGGDYGIAEAAPGQPNSNGSIESPNFFTFGTGPQADITVSAPGGGTYGMAGTSGTSAKRIAALARRFAHGTALKQKR